MNQIAITFVQKTVRVSNQKLKQRKSRAMRRSRIRKVEKKNYQMNHAFTGFDRMDR